MPVLSAGQTRVEIDARLAIMGHVLKKEDRMSGDKPRVLITGASGLIGGLTWQNLGHKYEFSGLNRRAVPEIPNIQADISDFDAILPAFEGIDMVIHMANYTSDEHSWDKHLQMGIIGTRNVYEASRLNGIKRVVLGSTGSRYRSGSLAIRFSTRSRNCRCAASSSGRPAAVEMP